MTPPNALDALTGYELAGCADRAGLVVFVNGVNKKNLLVAADWERFAKEIRTFLGSPSGQPALTELLRAEFVKGFELAHELQPCGHSRGDCRDPNYKPGDEFCESKCIGCEREAAFKVELDAEKRAHEEIASLCFENGASTDDGTSLGAVRGLVALKAEVRLARKVFDECMDGYDVGNTSKQTVLERINAALAAPPAVTRDKE